jgi:hypothetical protein
VSDPKLDIDICWNPEAEKFFVVCNSVVEGKACVWRSDQHTVDKAEASGWAAAHRAWHRR